MAGPTLEPVVKLKKRTDLAVKSFSRDAAVAACGAGYKPINLFYDFRGDLKKLWKIFEDAGVDPRNGGIPLALSIPHTQNKEFSSFDSRCEPLNAVLDNFCSTVDRGYRHIPGVPVALSSNACCQKPYTPACTRTHAHTRTRTHAIPCHTTQTVRMRAHCAAPHTRAMSFVHTCILHAYHMHTYHKYSMCSRTHALNHITPLPFTQCGTLLHATPIGFTPLHSTHCHTVYHQAIPHCAIHACNATAQRNTPRLLSLKCRVANHVPSVGTGREMAQDKAAVSAYVYFDARVGLQHL